MRKKVAVFLFFAALVVLYLGMPSPNFPLPLPNSVQSTQPADLEDTNRRGYYTDMSRAEIISLIEPQFKLPVIPSYRINYPPEEAQDRIRDQTKSSFLEEIVHPLRESLYISGYEPAPDKEPLVFANRTWKGKVIIKYVKSSLLVRLIIAGFAGVTIILLAMEYKKLFKLVTSSIKK